MNETTESHRINMALREKGIKYHHRNDQVLAENPVERQRTTKAIQVRHLHLAWRLSLIISRIESLANHRKRSRPHARRLWYMRIRGHLDGYTIRQRLRLWAQIQKTFSIRVDSRCKLWDTSRMLIIRRLLRRRCEYGSSS